MMVSGPNQPPRPPRSSSWRPGLLAIGQAAEEFFAGREVGLDPYCSSVANKIGKGRLRLAETAFDLGWS